MASRQSVSSILKLPKVRPPLKEIEPSEQDGDENTASLPKRKVSFSGMNKIKMYNTAATSLTVCHAPMYDEQFSMLSDSSNAEKTGKNEKSDTHTTLEATNCTDVENNGRVIIEYDSPNDNMEMTEAMTGKIFSQDTIYTIDNNESGENNLNLDCSDNMEFTEALKVGQILTVSNETRFDCSGMSEPSDDANDKESLTQTNDESTTQFFTKAAQNYLDVSNESNNMEITYANTESNNMEFTCITTKSQASGCSIDNSKCSNMEMTKVLDGKMYQVNTDLDEYTSMSIEAELSNEILQDSQCSPVTEPDDNLLSPHNLISNKSKRHETSCNDSEIIDEDLSSSLVSMDIDDVTKDYEYINKLVDNQEISQHNNRDQLGLKENYEFIGNKRETSFRQNRKSGNSLVPVTSYCVKNECSTMEGTNNNIKQKMYSRKSMALVRSIVQHESPEKCLVDKSVLAEDDVIEENSSLSLQNESVEKVETKEYEFKKYSRKSLAPIYALHNQVEPPSSEIIFDELVPIEQNEEDKNCTKSTVSELTLFTLNEPTEEIPLTKSFVEENQQKNIYRQSMAPTTVSLLSDDSVRDVNNSENGQSRLIMKNEMQSMLHNINNDDNDLNSPFRKKSRVSNDLSVMQNNIVDDNYLELSGIQPEIIAENKQLINTNLVSNMDVSVEYDPKNEDFANLSVDPMDVSSCSSYNTSMIKKIMSGSSIGEEEHYLTLLKSASKQGTQQTDQSFSKESSFTQQIGNFLQEVENSKKTDINSESHESKQNKLNDCQKEDVLTKSFEQLSESHKLVTNNFALEENKCVEKSIVVNLEKSALELIDQNSISCNSQDPFLEDISVLSIPNVNIQNCDSSVAGNRKRSYSNRDCNPLSHTFNSKQVLVKNEDFVHDLLIKDSSIQEPFCINEHPTECSVAKNSICIDNNEHYTTQNDLLDKEISRDVSIRETSSKEKPANDKLIKNYVDSVGLTQDNSVCYTSLYKNNSAHGEVSKDTLIDVSMEKCSNDENTDNSNFSKDGSMFKESVKEHLINEVSEFLNRWEKQFLDGLLVLEKCTNTKWIFNLLAKHLYLEISYFPMVDSHSFLKLEDISFSKSSTQNEVMKFGINWILSKYNPKMYKRICFTSGHIELLLKSLLEDVQFINNMMQSMSYLQDMHCVDFKDNKASFVIHQMSDHPMMTQIEVSLTNIHKLCAKDVVVDCIFGSFDMKAMGDIIETIPKDCDTLYSFIKKLKTLYK
ncbi:uncharacterized protein LOC126835957 [Adelges cooleyi]|uniref:uncharacterized protein LOC126835957 n=1 Tax=Adelges cooleyi TaxID=133065 RepID=UPI002180307A|nr:uncharacterized protein LOC126835957 [Adelges cooleyi]